MSDELLPVAPDLTESEPAAEQHGETKPVTRRASARIVQVGFLSACVTNGPPSATNRFLQSCAWQFRLSADVFGSLPMRMPPSSWMMRPPAAMPYPCSFVGMSLLGVPPISWISARNVCCMCFT